MISEVSDRPAYSQGTPTSRCSWTATASRIGVLAMQESPHDRRRAPPSYQLDRVRDGQSLPWSSVSRSPPRGLPPPLRAGRPRRRPRPVSTLVAGERLGAGRDACCIIRTDHKLAASPRSCCSWMGSERLASRNEQSSGSPADRRRTSDRCSVAGPHFQDHRTTGRRLAIGVEPVTCFKRSETLRGTALVDRFHEICGQEPVGF